MSAVEAEVQSATRSEPDMVDRGWRAYAELAKPRITRLVTVTAMSGFWLSAVGRGNSLREIWTALIGCLIGTALSSAGANALNQCMEISRDSRMARTRSRPLPSSRVSMSKAVLFGAALCVIGLATLWMLCGTAAMAVSATAILSYLLLYTPLKPLTVLNTWVGAIPGALPPVIGWCAASSGDGIWGGLSDSGAWSLFVLMYAWQIPHFLAIAWLHKEDYSRGGYRMLPVNDATGGATVTQILLWAVLLVPATMLPWWSMSSRVSGRYGLLALLTGGVFIFFASRMVRDRSRRQARRVFIASIIHLPILFSGLILDTIIKAWLR